MSKLQTRLHFNRINMQRGNPNVWTAHNSHGCFQAKTIYVVKNDEVLLETVFKPDGPQPRAYIKVKGNVQYWDDGIIAIEI